VEERLRVKNTVDLIHTGQVAEINQLNLYSTVHGNYWLPNPDHDCVLHAIINNQIWDNELVAYIGTRVLPNSVILDLGGNFGQMAVLFSRMVYDGSVHVFEADPFIYSALSRNIVENHCHNVMCYNTAVWHELGKTLFYPKADFKRFESYGSYGIDPTATNGQVVQSVTIDSLNLTKVDLIKIDIQGSDLNSMKGATSTINKFKPTIIFEYESLFNEQFNTCWEDYLNFIESINYKIVHTIDRVNIVIEPK
jgi:FkbM family methyltransferase